jgi:hypothetical protein
VYAPGATDPDFAQRAVLGALVDERPGMLSTDEVRRMLADVPDVDDAIALLVGDGVVHRIGHMLVASRAAVRAQQLRF